jgi:hypothetical protein
MSGVRDFPPLRLPFVRSGFTPVEKALAQPLGGL